MAIVICGTMDHAYTAPAPEREHDLKLSGFPSAGYLVAKLAC